MTSIRFPTPAHRGVLDEVLAELVEDPLVCGVLLGGSLARGTARVDSDLDVLVVATAPPGAFAALETRLPGPRSHPLSPRGT
ncbi:nucleotidyltransferase domain-containing protein [Actinokineospora sp. NBRC 105648]|uniref:nucleotidyltransferase domain-containing protein n=1 Tax=Actinokineospora sp. NBRC 105648 TaxID=3032206 RepID=UPI0024A18A6D|nr:nucleotidyltransferase domain-containing protein [Actinokineospora sp. NBRC 105648]GLZ37060.1 hypothetical protein Acsp05_06850 [Actinokineospora sp. NBRC 105648]